MIESLINAFGFFLLAAFPLAILFSMYLLGHNHGYSSCEKVYEGLFHQCNKIISNRDKLCNDCKSSLEKED